MNSLPHLPRHRHLLFGLLLLLNSGCAVYAPSLLQTPLLKERGTGEVGVSYHAPVSGEIHAAYSPTTHVLVMGSISGCRYSSTSATSVYRFDVTQGSLGLGLYTPFGNGHWDAGLLSGAGVGGSLFQHQSTSSPDEVYRSTYVYVFGQPYVAWHTGPLSLGVAARFNNLYYSKFEINEVRPSGPVPKLYQAYSVFARVRGEDDTFQYQLQFGYSTPLGYQARPGSPDVLLSSFIVGAGLVFHFGGE